MRFFCLCARVSLCVALPMVVASTALAADSRLILSEEIQPLRKPVVVRAEVHHDDRAVDVGRLRTSWAARPAVFDFLADPAWVTIPARWQDDGAAALDMSGLRPGRYEVALLVEELPGYPALTHPLRVLGKVGIADTLRPIHASVFTDRNRQVFATGEAIGVTLSVGVAPEAAHPAEAEAALVLRRPADSWTMTLERVRFHPREFAGRRRSFRHEMRPAWTLALEAGDYELDVVPGDANVCAVGQPVPLRLVDSQARSGTPSVLYLIGSNAWTGGGHTGGSRHGIDNVGAMIGGFGADCILTWGSDIPRRTPQDWVQRVPHPDSPLLGA